MKPDWRDSPSLAKWLAMDEDGTWYWYECEPTFSEDDGFWEKPCGYREAAWVREWRESLEKRP